MHISSAGHNSGYPPQIFGLSRAFQPDSTSGLKPGSDEDSKNSFLVTDKIDISQDGLSRYKNPQNIEGDDKSDSPGNSAVINRYGGKTALSKETASESKRSEETKPSGEALSEAELSEVERLRKRDQKVRAHEQAHASAAGELASGGIHFDYETGPDGGRYATGGHVGLRMPDAPSPEEDLRIARKVERAALAPADPSPQDRAIANKARQKAAAAQREIAQREAKKLEKENGSIQNGEEKPGENDYKAVSIESNNTNRTVDGKMTGPDDLKIDITEKTGVVKDIKNRENHADKTDRIHPDPNGDKPPDRIAEILPGIIRLDKNTGQNFNMVV